jgi:hypothetical protein
VVHESAFAIRTRHGGPQQPIDPYENDSGWVTSMARAINTEKTRGGGPGNFGAGRVPGAADYLQRLTDVRGEAFVQELLGAEIQMMVFPGFFIQPGRQHFRVLRPVAVDRTEVWAYPYTLRGAPDDFNRFMVQDVAWWASAAGFGQPDDLEQFVRAQKGLQAGYPEWVMFHRGTHNEALLPTGEIRGHAETTHRGIYREWKRLMTQPV